MIATAKTRSVRGLCIFLAFVFVFSLGLTIDGAKLSRPFGRHSIAVYMWSVAGASLVARLWMRESLRDVSFGWKGWATTRAMLVATAFPIMVALLVCAIGWCTGLVHFAPTPTPTAAFGIPLTGPPVVRFLQFLLINLFAGGLLSCRAAAGEEIGWRGYMLTRLNASRIPIPICVSGLIWSAWHFPLILGGQYQSVPKRVFPISVFVVDITAFAFILAWLRLSSGSIWPCIWAHGVWNAILVRSEFWSIRSGGVWLGEAGVLNTVVVIALAIVIFRLWPLPASNDDFHQKSGPGGP
jgi:uncharacterized protein